MRKINRKTSSPESEEYQSEETVVSCEETSLQDSQGSAAPAPAQWHWGLGSEHQSWGWGMAAAAP